jgi:hypothetical protein
VPESKGGPGIIPACTHQVWVNWVVIMMKQVVFISTKVSGTEL